MLVTVQRIKTLITLIVVYDSKITNYLYKIIEGAWSVLSSPECSFFIFFLNQIVMMTYSLTYSHLFASFVPICLHLNFLVVLSYPILFFQSILQLQRFQFSRFLWYYNGYISEPDKHYACKVSAKGLQIMSIVKLQR